ncbi:MAG TPA: DUF4173 domain-containing protein [Steroidobacteraceae bacterium]|nr:DUF4173 domain-containing protein [Steroidobacteraceae bacterium]
MTQSTLADLAPPRLRALRPPRPERLAWLGAAFVATLATLTLYDASPGLNWSVALWSLAAGFALLDAYPLAERRALLALSAALAGVVAISANLGVQLPLALASAWVGAVAVLSDGVAPPGSRDLARAPWRASRRVLGEAGERLGDGIRSARGQDGLPVVRGSVLALVVVAAFFGLLAQADPTLAAWRAQLLAALGALSLFGRLAFFAGAAAVTLGLFGAALRAYRRTSRPAVADAGVSRPLTPVDQGIVLGAVAALFALFLVLQLADLFGDPGGRLGSGVTYAEAVHRGFIEITLVVTLCALLVLVFDERTRPRRPGVGRALGLALTGECLLLLGSAAHRLALYAAAYGYTRLRLYVAAYIIVVAAALIALAVELATGVDRGRLTRRVALAALGAALVLGYWNHSAWIVGRNLERYARTGAVDVAYLATGGGLDGVPALAHALPGLDPPTRRCVLSLLAVSYGDRPGAASQPAWYEWTLRGAEARAALAKLGLGAASGDPDACR